jgi:hypothetical protein
MRDLRPSLALSLFLLLGIVAFIIVDFKKISNRPYISPLNQPLDWASGGIEERYRRIECEFAHLACITDLDCSNRCILKDNKFACIKGECMPEQVKALPAKEHVCDPYRGEVPYLIADGYGSWDVACMSVDPGISSPNKPNKICVGESPTINYLKEFPTIQLCTGPNCVTIPATSQIREYQICDNPTFSNLAKLMYTY